LKQRPGGLSLRSCSGFGFLRSVGISAGEEARFLGRWSTGGSRGAQILVFTLESQVGHIVLIPEGPPFRVRLVRGGSLSLGLPVGMVPPAFLLPAPAVLGLGVGTVPRLGLAAALAVASAAVALVFPAPAVAGAGFIQLTLTVLLLPLPVPFFLLGDPAFPVHLGVVLLIRPGLNSRLLFSCLAPPSALYDVLGGEGGFAS
jgi:hypothetical protein